MKSKQWATNQLSKRLARHLDGITKVVFLMCMRHKGEPSCFIIVIVGLLFHHHINFLPLPNFFFYGLYHSLDLTWVSIASDGEAQVHTNVSELSKSDIIRLFGRTIVKIFGHFALRYVLLSISSSSMSPPPPPFFSRALMFRLVLGVMWPNIVFIASWMLVISPCAVLLCCCHLTELLCWWCFRKHQINFCCWRWR